MVGVMVFASATLFPSLLLTCFEFAHVCHIYDPY